MKRNPRCIEVPDDAMVEVLRRMTGAQRLKISHDMYESARRMLLSHLRCEHPDWDAARIDRDVVRRLSHGTA